MFGKLDQKVVADMMAAADTDGDGDISLAEFKVIMRSAPKGLSQVTKAMTDPDTMKLMFRNAREDLEEVDLILRLRGEGMEAETKKEFNDKRERLNDQVSTLSEFMSALDVEAAEEVDLEAAAAAAAAEEAAKARQGGCAEITKTAVTVLKNTISGVLTIYLYFMDLNSDYQVTVLFYEYAPPI
jgi:hypothetical protein